MTVVFSRRDAEWFAPPGAAGRRYLLAPLTYRERQAFRADLAREGGIYPSHAQMLDALREAVREAAPDNAAELLGVIDAAEATPPSRCWMARTWSMSRALLHDLGHVPFSHTFEGVQEARGVKKRHEQWTAEIIRNETGGIRPLLEAFSSGFTEKIALLLEKEDPEDIYHAVVSSSFDADRLDYLRRDKLMTGTGAGGIAFDWLIENIRVAPIMLDVPDLEDEGAPRTVPTFCLDRKALPAAEQFLLARYTLHEQVYFHKTTRCVEQMIGRLFRGIAGAAVAGEEAARRTGLPPQHPLLRFFGEGGETVENYLALDDMLVLGALEVMTHADDLDISGMARRLRGRKLYKTLDMAEFGADKGIQASRKRRIDAELKDQLSQGIVILDDKAAIGIYSEIGGDEERMHKRLHILDGNSPKEVSTLSPLLKALETKKQFIRFYFAETADRDKARVIKGRA